MIVDRLTIYLERANGRWEAWYYEHDGNACPARRWFYSHCTGDAIRQAIRYSGYHENDVKIVHVDACPV